MRLRYIILVLFSSFIFQQMAAAGDTQERNRQLEKKMKADGVEVIIDGLSISKMDSFVNSRLLRLLNQQTQALLQLNGARLCSGKGE